MSEATPLLTIRTVILTMGTLIFVMTMRNMVTEQIIIIIIIDIDIRQSSLGEESVISVQF
jgi:hypothetical protein